MLSRNPESSRPERDHLIRELRRNLRGEVSESYAERVRFSRDESIFTQIPSVVVAPEGEADLQIVVALAQFFSVPITARGAGTGVAGGAIGPGILMDFSRNFRAIERIEEESVVVQPGVVLAHLNAKLAQLGRRIGPDPLSLASCTVGGMVGTNAAGPRSLRYGSTRDQVRRLRVVLADGAVMESSTLGRRFPMLGERFRSERERIASASPRTRKNASGYALEELCGESPDFARFLTGSEGTLALISEIELKTVPLAPSSVLAVFPFRSLEDAAAAAGEMASLGPASLELADRHVHGALGAINSAILSALRLDEAEASLWAEWEGEMPSGTDLSGAHVVEDREGPSNLRILLSKAERRLGEGRGRRIPLRCIEDGIVPPERFSDYVRGIRELLAEQDCDGAIYGHAGDGHLHVLPRFDVEAPGLPERIHHLMEGAFALVRGLGGSISGEHGDGVLRRLQAEMQGGEVLELAHLVKEVFDPAGIFNPEKKFPAGPSILPPYRDFRSPGLAAPPLPEAERWKKELFA